MTVVGCKGADEVDLENVTKLDNYGKAIGKCLQGTSYRLRVFSVGKVLH